MSLNGFTLLLCFLPFVLCNWNYKVDDPEVIRLSQLALSKLNEGKEGNEATIVEIVKATRPMLSPMTTKLILKVSQGDIQSLCKFTISDYSSTDVTIVNCADADSAVEEPVSENDLNLNLFNEFIKTYNKTYTDEKEHQKRFRIFRANIKKIKTLRETEQGTAQYGLTRFADLSTSEFKRYLGLKPSKTEEYLPPAEIPDIDLPENYDWRKYNVVTPVKNQESCGSCWAFSVTGDVEGQWAIKSGKLVSLSEQELVDCDSVDKGCDGGDMTVAYKQIIKLGGLETESDYPYTAKDGTCHFNKTMAKVQISGAVNISSDEVKMAQWLVKNGPMSIGINALPMQFYFGGISHPLKVLCSPDDLDHGVLIVGFGVRHSVILKRRIPFWIIKNSWGKHWGERGYYRLYRGDGSCGVNRMVSSAIVNFHE